MKKIVIPITLLILMLTGCGAKNPWPKDFDLLSDDPNYIYARAMAESKNQQHSINSARHQARVELGRQLESKIGAMFKMFMEETGAASDSELLQMTTDVSKSVVSKVLYGTRPIKEQIKREDSIYRAYVLISMPIGEANAELMAQIKARERMYTRFRASQAFKELENEIDKYDKFKKEQEIP